MTIISKLYALAESCNHPNKEPYHLPMAYWQYLEQKRTAPDTRRTADIGFTTFELCPSCHHKLEKLYKELIKP